MRAWIWVAAGAGVAGGLWWWTSRARAVDTVRTDRAAAAEQLRAYLQSSDANFGTRRFPSDEVRNAQQALGVEPDGIVGPQTREAAAAHGVQLPPRQTASGAPVDDEVVVETDDAVAEHVDASAPTVRPVVVSVRVQVPFLKRGFVPSTSEMERDIQRYSQRNRAKLQQCPDMPQLEDRIGVRVSDLGGGAYQLVVRWRATWGPGQAATRNMRNCVARFVRNHPDVGSMVTAVSVD